MQAEFFNFKNLSAIQCLDLSMCRISKNQFEVILNLRTITELDLSGENYIDYFEIINLFQLKKLVLKRKKSLSGIACLNKLRHLNSLILDGNVIDKLTLDSICKISSLKVLHVKECTLSYDLSLKSLGLLYFLEEFQFTETRDEVIEDTIVRLSELPVLERITLENVHISNLDLMSRVTELALVRCFVKSDISGSISRMINLKSLRITELSYPPKSFMLANLRSLNNFDLSGIDDENSMSYLKNLDHLKKLRLCNIDLKCEGPIFQFKGLDFLILQNCWNISQFIENIHLKLLMHVDLSETDIKDEVVEIICRNNRYIDTLLLSNTSITSTSMEIISSYLNDLVYLSLSGCHNLTGKVLQWVNKVPNLNYLDISSIERLGSNHLHYITSIYSILIIDISFSLISPQEVLSIRYPKNITIVQVECI